MGFRLTPRSMTLDDLERSSKVRSILSEFRVMSRLWKATMAKRIKIDLYYLRQNCSHVNVLFSDV